MIVEYKGKQISNIKDWKKCAKKKDWKVGRSAYSLADFIINKKGETYINNEVSKVIGEDLTLNKSYPEHEVRFDKYGQGRVHDLGIYGTTKSGKKVFIGVEAKVDETFGNTISGAYLEAKVKELNSKRTNAPKRIEELLTRNFGELKKNYFNLHYQLLYSTLGTTHAKADMHLFFVLVFKTSLSNVDKIKNSKKDYINFFGELGAIRLPQSDNFEAEIEGKKLMVIYKMV